MIFSAFYVLSAWDQGKQSTAGEGGHHSSRDCQCKHSVPSRGQPSPPCAHRDQHQLVNNVSVFTLSPLDPADPDLCFEHRPLQENCPGINPMPKLPIGAFTDGELRTGNLSLPSESCFLITLLFWIR